MFIANFNLRRLKIKNSAFFYWFRWLDFLSIILYFCRFYQTQKMIHQIVVNQHEWHIFLNRNAMHCRSSEYWKSIEAQLTSAQVPYCCHYAQSQKEDAEVILNCCRNGVRHFVVVGFPFNIKVLLIFCNQP